MNIKDDSILVKGWKRLSTEVASRVISGVFLFLILVAHNFYIETKISNSTIDLKMEITVLKLEIKLLKLEVEQYRENCRHLEKQLGTKSD